MYNPTEEYLFCSNGPIEQTQKSLYEVLMAQKTFLWVTLGPIGFQHRPEVVGLRGSLDHPVGKACLKGVKALLCWCSMLLDVTWGLVFILRVCLDIRLPAVLMVDIRPSPQQHLAELAVAILFYTKIQHWWGRL